LTTSGRCRSPGLCPKDINGTGLTKDRYRLGTAVTGTVAWQWFKRWSDARKPNDRVKEREATAMATAKGWSILKEMAKEGDGLGVDLVP
jgi:hypothetical protein